MSRPTRPPAPRPGPVLALVGPTAAGKSELALAVAYEDAPYGVGYLVAVLTSP